MERVTAVLAEARTAGLTVQVEDRRLVVRGPREQEALAQELLRLKSDVVAYLTLVDGSDVAWRADVMRRQVPISGPIPLLIARDAPQKHSNCISCGEQLSPDQKFRCSACTRAVWLVLHEIREDVNHVS